MENIKSKYIKQIHNTLRAIVSEHPQSNVLSDLEYQFLITTLVDSNYRTINKLIAGRVKYGGNFLDTTRIDYLKELRMELIDANMYLEAAIFTRPVDQEKPLQKPKA